MSEGQNANQKENINQTIEVSPNVNIPADIYLTVRKYLLEDSDAVLVTLILVLSAIGCVFWKWVIPAAVTYHQAFERLADSTIQKFEEIKLYGKEVDKGLTDVSQSQETTQGTLEDIQKEIIEVKHDLDRIKEAEVRIENKIELIHSKLSKHP